MTRKQGAAVKTSGRDIHLPFLIFSTPILKGGGQQMEIKVTLYEIIVKDKKTGKEFTVKTLRTAEEIASYIEESEKEEIVARLETIVCEAYQQ
jgi:hypothetical protein